MVFDVNIILTCLAIFLLRAIDVSMETFRTISVIHGRLKIAFILGFFEIIIWAYVISIVIDNINKSFFFVIAYALGYSVGNVIGAIIESKIGLGNVVLKVLSKDKNNTIVNFLREAGYKVITFDGKDNDGFILEMYLICPRRKINTIINIVEEMDPDAYYVIADIKEINKDFNLYIEDIRK